jgi:hypothetical protein
MDTQNMNDFYSYDGSLTTPPCTEGIKWSVLQTVQPISAGQLADYTNLWASKLDFAGGNGNNRAVQPWNYRAVLDSSEYGSRTLPIYTGADFLAASIPALAALTAFSSLF